MLKILCLYVLILLATPGRAGAEDPPPFLLKWGTRGSAPGQFGNPQGVALDQAGNVYVADLGNSRVQKFDPLGNLLLTFGGYGSGPGQFNEIRGIAIASNGNIYAADQRNHRVQVFSPTGTFLFAWGSFGDSPGQFNEPWGIAIDDSASVYVSDFRNSRIEKFSATGELLNIWSNTGNGRGQFGLPAGIALNPTGEVYLIDRLNGDVDIYTRNGQFIRDFDTGLDGPLYVASDLAGNVFVTNHQSAQVTKFTPTGVLLTAWGSFGRDDGEFLGPTGIAVDESGNVYVAESFDTFFDNGNDRIQKFGRTATSTLGTTFGALKARYR